MSEKKKNILGKFFNGNSGCGCGVKIVEEAPKEKSSKTVSTKDNKK